MNRNSVGWVVFLGVAVLAWVLVNRHPNLGLPALPGSTNGGAGAISVHFSPHGGCEQAVVDQINNARTSIDFQAYSFTNYNIARALVAARDRGVHVLAVLDEKATREEYRQPDFIASHGIETYTDGEHPIAHNKVVVIDNSTVITGSYNFTEQAEKANAENLLIISGNPGLASQYDANFREHMGHSQRYSPGAEPAESAPRSRGRRD